MDHQKNSPMLIGSTITIAQATNATLINLCGRVVDETKSTITIATEKGEKKIIKHGVAIHHNGFTIQGNTIIGRIDERIVQKK